MKNRGEPRRFHASAFYLFHTDFAVGAHEGDGAAVVLRTRPVMRLQLSVSSNTEILTKPGQNFTVQICISYTGFNVPDEISKCFVGILVEQWRL